MRPDQSLYISVIRYGDRSSLWRGVRRCFFFLPGEIVSESAPIVEYSLIFLSLVFRHKQRKTTQNDEDILPPPTPRKRLEKRRKIVENAQNHRVLQGAPPRGRPLYFTFPSAPDPLFNVSEAPFLTLRVATVSGENRQAPLDKTPRTFPWLEKSQDQGNSINSVHTRCIVKTSGFIRGVCKNRGFY